MTRFTINIREPTMSSDKLKESYQNSSYKNEMSFDEYLNKKVDLYTDKETIARRVGDNIEISKRKIIS